MENSLQDHLDPARGPKKILSLDGGGIRGALTLGYLKKIEDILRKQNGGDPNFRLSDYYDLIGGTSTGSIIAAALAVGMPVDEVKGHYMNLGGEIFGNKRSWLTPWEKLKANYDFSPLENHLQKVFGTTTLGSDEIKTGLCIVAKRADTNSTWPMINHPKGIFYDSEQGKNKNIPLWQALRASSAAPTYFAPQMVDVGNNLRAAFIDGGVSTANNPALTLLMVATLKGFPFGWKLGEGDLWLTSVGTGYRQFKKLTGEIEDAWIKNWAEDVPEMLMQDSSWQNQAILQWLSNSPTASTIDTEIGKLAEDNLGPAPLIKYLRYDFPITENELNGLGMDRNFTLEDEESLIDMSVAENREILYEIGSAAALSEKGGVRAEHFG